MSVPHLLSFSVPRSIMTERRNMPLVGGDVIEKVAPTLEVPFAEAVAMGDYAISVECHLRRLSVDLQLLQHAFIRVSNGPW